MEHALEVKFNNDLIFYSDGKWLYPLFELERFLSEADYDRTNLVVQDKIVGKAAALFLVYLNINHVIVPIISKPGKIIFDTFGVNYDYQQLVERIACRTEEMLLNKTDPTEAYRLLKKLANRE